MSSIGLTSDISFYVFFLYIINYFVVVVILVILLFQIIAALNLRQRIIKIKFV